MPRELRPRPQVATAPIYISQHTAPAQGFKTEASFLAFVNASGVRHTRIGKTVMVDVDDLRAAIRGMASTEAAPVAVADDEPQSEAEVLARLGFRKCGS